MASGALFETESTNNKELYCVYCHINKINGKRYIGQTGTSPEKRWGKNGEGYMGNAHFWSSIQKYGWNNFDHIIIQDNLTKEEADLLEDLNIRTFNTIDRNYGYNFRYGGSHGKLSEESKRKLSDSIKKLYDGGFTHPMQGKHHSEESKKKDSESIKQKWKDKYYREKVVNSWSYDKHFSKETKQKLSESYKKYRKDHPEAIEKCVKAMRKSRMHSVDMYDLEGNYIQTFESIAEACKLGFSSSKISEVCNGHRKHHKGYIWKYHEKGGET